MVPKWNLYFNVLKCKCIHFGTNNPCYSYKINSNSDINIPVGEDEKDIGVTFDSTLKFDNHINNKVTKANQVLGIIKRNFLNVDKCTFCKLYKAMIRPHLEYCNVIWSPVFKRQSIKIEAVQRRATKIVLPLKDLPYKARV